MKWKSGPSSIRPILQTSSAVVAMVLFVLVGKVPSAQSEAAVPTDESMRRVAATVGDVRNVGVAMYGWRQSQSSGEAPAADTEKVTYFEWKDCPAVSHAALVGHLSPRFLQKVPAKDPWGNDYEFCLDPDLKKLTGSIGVRAPGSDGEFEGDVYAVGAFHSDQTDHDIVWIDGYFITWPSKAAD